MFASRFTDADYILLFYNPFPVTKIDLEPFAHLAGHNFGQCYLCTTGVLDHRAIWSQATTQLWWLQYVLHAVKYWCRWNCAVQQQDSSEEYDRGHLLSGLLLGHNLGTFSVGIRRRDIFSAHSLSWFVIPTDLCWFCKLCSPSSLRT